MSTPSWYDERFLVRIKFEQDESGWAIDMGNGLYRLANSPIRSWGGYDEAASWGDLVRLVPNNGDDSWLEIVEKYVDEEENNNE